MPRNPSPAQSHASEQNGKRSRGPTSPEGKARSALSSKNSGLRAQTIALDHESPRYNDRCDQWHDFYQPQSPAALHYTNECARASLLSDRCAEYRQAVLQKQVRDEERTWNRKQQRRLRYLMAKIKTSPGETLGQLKTFGLGVGFLFDSFEALIDAVRNWGYLPPNLAEIALQLGGCTLEPESIRANLLAYTIQINNLGCTPGVPAAVIDSWLEPARRPAALGDRPRQEVMSSNPGECRERLLRALEDRARPAQGPGRAGAAGCRRSEPSGGARSRLDPDRGNGPAAGAEPDGGEDGVPPGVEGPGQGPRGGSGGGTAARVCRR